jgi:hypothetical protein
VPSAQTFDRVFDRVPVSDSTLLGAWTFDEGAGSVTRAVGASAAAYYAPTTSTDPPIAVGSDANLIANLWAGDDDRDRHVAGGLGRHSPSLQEA